jgi:TonB family protein
MLRFASFLCTLLLVAFPAAPQDPLQEGPAHAPYAGMREWVNGEYIVPVPNAPFSGKVLLESKQTLPDGSTVTKKTVNVVARDSQGRCHNEGRKLIAFSENKEPEILFISILDPAQRTRWAIYPSQHSVKVFHTGPPSTTLPHAPPPPGVTVSTTNLGTRTLEGFQVQGTRETRTFAEGLFGNEKAFEVIDEYWFSPELQVNIVARHEDPRTGVQTIGLTEISRAEPDPKLFEIPEGFRREDQGRVTTSLPPGVRPPRLISKTEPEYTPEARREKVSGDVALSVQLAADGTVQDVQVVRSLRPDLDQSAVNAVRQWRFQPATKDGSPIPFRISVSVSFRLG